ncbi:MAG: hypothetical protein GC168_17985 [Candidatus Hydrogenedens sp.]|nr:hypothetical protein [Candidatus Hydrogenedens sp.]
MGKRALLLFLVGLCVPVFTGCQQENTVNEGVWRMTLRDGDGQEVYRGLYLSYPKSDLLIELVRVGFESADFKQLLYTQAFFPDFGSVGFIVPVDNPDQVDGLDLEDSASGLMFSVSSNPLQWFSDQSDLMLATGNISFVSAYEAIGDGQFQFVPVNWKPFISLFAGGELPDINPTFTDFTDPDAETVEVTGFLDRTSFQLPDIGDLVDIVQE